jgi:hypothetical protein
MWRNIDKSRPDSAHYSVMAVDYDGGATGMAGLRAMFPDAGGINEMNLVLFSTSGVHGTYTLIEDVENTLKGRAKQDYEVWDVTFLIVHPRLVALRYGECRPQNLADIEYLKSLRAASTRVFAEIGTAPTQSKEGPSS